MPGLTHEIGLEKSKHVSVTPDSIFTFTTQASVDGTVLAEHVEGGLRKSATLRAA